MVAPSRPNDIKAAVSLVLSVISSLIALGGIAYSAGALTTRVATVEEQVHDLKGVPVDVAEMKRDIAYLVEAEKRRRDRNEHQ